MRYARRRTDRRDEKRTRRFAAACIYIVSSANRINTAERYDLANVVFPRVIVVFNLLIFIDLCFFLVISSILDSRLSILDEVPSILDEAPSILDSRPSILDGRPSFFVR